MGIGSASWARKRTALASCFGSSMPDTSIVRTPMRLLARPIRTFRFGSLFLLKNSFSAFPSAATSRTSPPAISPGGSDEPASWTTSTEPLTATHAALSREAPSLRPTTFLATGPPSASGHAQAGALIVAREQPVPLEEAPQLVGPARPLQGDLGGDLPGARELEHGLLE